MIVYGSLKDGGVVVVKAGIRKVMKSVVVVKAVDGK